MTKEILDRSKAIIWIHRLLNERTQELLKISEEISILNHQAENFDKMAKVYQDRVLLELNLKFDKLNWNYHFTLEEFEK